jgi:hypothetical protein
MLVTNELDIFLQKISEFKEASSRLSNLDEFSKHFEERRKVFEGFGENVSSEYKEIAISFEDLLEKFFFVTLVNRRKVDAINSLIEFSIDSKNAIALAQGIRALLEHASVIALISKEAEKLKMGLDGLNEFSKIKSLLNKSDSFIYRCYFGKSGKVEHDKAKQAVHINDGLDLLKDRLIDIDKDYDYLCEFVHPNHGSNLLISTSDVEKYLMSIESNFDRDEIIKMIVIGNKTLEVIDGDELFIYSMISILSTVANRFTTKGTKLSNVFSVRKPEIKGDGKTKETALFVSNGRDTAEEMKFIYNHFQKNSYQIYGQNIAEMSDGFIYDLFETSKGKVWVRMSLEGLDE